MENADRETIRQFTVRLPEDLLRAASRIAKKRRTSVNALVRASLQRLAREDRQATLRASYDLLGSHQDEADAEFFRAAQDEVLERGD